MPHLRSLVALALLIGLATSVRAESKDWPVPRGPSREPELIAFDPGVLKNVPADYLQRYPACYLKAATWYFIEPDGTVECTTHEIVRLNNRKGIDQLGEHRNVTYRPDQEHLTLNEARVHKPDGTRIVVEPKHVQVRDVQTDYFVYDATKELIISFPGLEPGDIIETKWTTRGKNPEYAGRFFTRYQFGDDRSPIWHETFGVLLPRDKTLKYTAINPHLVTGGKLEPELTEKGVQNQFVWRTRDRLPLLKEEMPPSKEELRPGVAISTFASWQEVADWERKIRAHCWECTLDLKKIVEQIKREHSEPEAIARADLLGSRPHSLCLLRRPARLHSPRPVPDSQEPLRRLQGWRSDARRAPQGSRHRVAADFAECPGRRTDHRKRAFALDHARDPAGDHQWQGSLDRYHREPRGLGLPAQVRLRSVGIRHRRHELPPLANTETACGRESRRDADADADRFRRCQPQSPRNDVSRGGGAREAGRVA